MSSFTAVLERKFVPTLVTLLPIVNSLRFWQLKKASSPIYSRFFPQVTLVSLVQSLKVSISRRMRLSLRVTSLRLRQLSKALLFMKLTLAPITTDSIEVPLKAFRSMIFTGVPFTLSGITRLVMELSARPFTDAHEPFTRNLIPSLTTSSDELESAAYAFEMFSVLSAFDGYAPPTSKSAITAAVNFLIFIVFYSFYIISQAAYKVLYI